MATVNLSSIITPANIVTASGTETLTNKTIAFASNTLTGVQPTLVSGTSIKTVNSTSLLGSGDIAISAGFTLGTPVAATSGTSITFTGIPAGTKQIIVSFRGVSTSGNSAKVMRLGDSGGIETTGYASIGASVVNGTNNISNGFSINSADLTAVLNGSIRLTLENSTNYEYVASGTFSQTGGNNDSLVTSGGKALSAELDRLSITTQNGTDTFDAGEINILYI